MKNLGSSRPLVPPLYQSSVYCLPDLDALERIYNGEEAGFVYARDGHPAAHHLGERLAKMEVADWGVVCGSGMAAISAILLSVLQQGDRVVASDQLYGRTSQLFLQELSRFGIETTFVDCGDLDQVGKALASGRLGDSARPPRMLFVETLSNPLLRLVPVEALAAMCRQQGILFAVDNTFATPVLCRPLEKGADLVVESLTKMIGGHSDITLGAVCGTKNDTLPLEQVHQVVSIWGLASPPFDCWLALRSLDTLSLRMLAASDNAQALADWFAEQKGVARVIYPGRPDHPDHQLASTMLDGSRFGNMLCFELEGGKDAVNRFMHQASGVVFSPSLGNTTTTCSHPASTSHRHASPKEKRRLGISEGLIRLSVGIEPLPEIQQEIQKGLP